MRVIKDKQLVEDSWQLVRESEQLPEGDIIVSFPYWSENKTSLEGHKGKIAVYLNGDDEVENLKEDLDQFELIALDFPAFKDGRCYSHARLLRERYGYSGELRAIGEVLRDQLFFMNRCGITSFELPEGKDAEDVLKGFSDFSVTYQTAADGALPAYKYRN